MPTIEKTELESIMRSWRGDEIFTETLRHASDPRCFISLLANYIQFNSLAGTGAAQSYLAAQVALRLDIFQDHNETLNDFSDRSVEIAKDIFFAAIDELSDVTHRLLALATLKGCMQFFGFTSNAITTIRPATRMAMERIRHGYGIDRTLVDEFELFEAIGFHLGSERTADPEFKNLADVLDRTYPRLVNHLQNTTVEISGLTYACYPWIGDHIRVEEGHADKALRGTNQALRYFTGDRLQAKTAVLNGVRNFLSVQTDFALSLLEP